MGILCVDRVGDKASALADLAAGKLVLSAKLALISDNPDLGRKREGTNQTRIMVSRWVKL